MPNDKDTTATSANMSPELNYNPPSKWGAMTIMPNDTDPTKLAAEARTWFYVGYRQPDERLNRLADAIDTLVAERDHNVAVVHDALKVVCTERDRLRDENARLRASLTLIAEGDCMLHAQVAHAALAQPKETTK